MKHRGKHSNDDKIFSKKWYPILKEAASDLSFLLGKSYGQKSAIALVGNRYQLNKRQQRALALITCPADKRESRIKKHVPSTYLEGKSVIIDGYNLLIIIEAALSGAYVFKAQDGCFRDIASIHGTYKKVEETIPALELIDSCLKELKVNHVQWYFDSPVSNSGRLKSLLYELATKNESNWDIDLVYNPDSTMIEKNELSITCDSWILDEVDAFFDLSGYIIEQKIKNENLLNFF